MTKQVIVVNKGLNMSKGKMSTQVAHAAMAPFFKEFLNPKSRQKYPLFDQDTNLQTGYVLTIPIDFDTMDWIEHSFTKVVCQVKNERELQKVVDKAIANGFIEDKDFVKIIDNGLTEFNNIPTWTCIGFKPMEEEKIDIVTKKLQLYKD